MTTPFANFLVIFKLTFLHTFQMCGIFALLLNKPIDQNSSEPILPNFSWRQLWNNLMKIKGRGPDNTALKQISPHLILGF